MIIYVPIIQADIKVINCWLGPGDSFFSHLVKTNSHLVTIPDLCEDPTAATAAARCRILPFTPLTN